MSDPRAMALRSLSRVSTPTSGPGRGPGSDSRVRHRRPPERGHARHRSPVPAEELRRRAERLFGEPGVESGSGPPVGVGAPSEVPLADSGRRERAGLALRDRVPMWVQARCGVERRSVLALAVLLVLAAALAAQHFWTGRTQNVSAPQVVREAPVRVKAREAGDGSGSVTTPGSPGAQIVVDVGGKVRDPGIRRLPSGSRVADALKAAGGVRPGVRAEGLNRARFLVDGEQIVVGASGVRLQAARLRSGRVRRGRPLGVPRRRSRSARRRWNSSTRCPAWVRCWLSASSTTAPGTGVSARWTSCARWTASVTGASRICGHGWGRDGRAGRPRLEG